MGKSGGVWDPGRALFSLFFRGRFGLRTGSRPWPPGEGGGGILDGGSRSRIATSASTANGFAETRHRSSSRSSLALDRIPIADRVRAELASNLARSASTWHKDNHRSDPIADRNSQHLLTIFDRSERSRTSFDARGKLSASSIDLRSLRDWSDLASSDTFARANVMSGSDRS